MSSLGIRVNLKNEGISQYADVTINSLCVFNGVVLGSNDNGIFSLSGNKDGATNINAFFQTFSTDFNDVHSKFFRKLQLFGNTEGGLDVSVICDNDKKTVVTSNPLGIIDQQQLDIKSDRSNFGMFLGVEVRNIDGSDFTIDAISCNIVPVVIRKYTTERVARAKIELPFLIITVEGV